MAHHVQVGFVVVRSFAAWPGQITAVVNAQVYTLPLRKGFE
jgi:hypothetical protein